MKGAEWTPTSKEPLKKAPWDRQYTTTLYDNDSVKQILDELGIEPGQTLRLVKTRGYAPDPRKVISDRLIIRIDDRTHSSRPTPPDFTVEDATGTVTSIFWGDEEEGN